MIANNYRHSNIDALFICIEALDMYTEDIINQLKQVRCILHTRNRSVMRRYNNNILRPITDSLYSIEIIQNFSIEPYYQKQICNILSNYQKHLCCDTELSHSTISFLRRFAYIYNRTQDIYILKNYYNTNTIDLPSMAILHLYSLHRSYQIHGTYVMMKYLEKQYIYT